MLNRLVWLILLCSSLLLACSTGDDRDDDYFRESASRYFQTTLDNGFEVILVENHANPVVASVVTVKTGLCNEDYTNNGVSHFLEHLLFNGTGNRTQKQLYEEMDFLGGYNNASTSDDYTNYMVLIAKEHVDVALDIQSDMLFNSILPRDKLEKERGIIIEEIRQARSRSDYDLRRYISKQLYRGSPYSMPILGSEASVTNMTRDTILKYYRTYYVPNNMILMAIGDFDRDDILAQIEKYFGRHKAGLVTSRPNATEVSAAGESITAVDWDTENVHLSLTTAAPAIDDPGFLAFDLLVHIVNSDGEHGLRAALENSSVNGMLDISASHEFHPDLSLLVVSAELEKGADPQQAVAAICDYFDRRSRILLPKELVNSARISVLTDEAIALQRSHHYGMLKSQHLALAGGRFVRTYMDKVAGVGTREIRSVARRFLRHCDFEALIVQPKEQIREETGRRDVLKQRALENGLLAIAKENCDADLFAVHVLLKDRSAREPDGKTGIAEFLHRVILRGTQDHDKNQLVEALAEIGVTVKTVDDSRIPFDDYYTRNEYSYFRLECLGMFQDEGLSLLEEILCRPAFDEEEIESVRSEMLDLLQKKKRSVSAIARQEFDRAAYGNSPLSKPILGTSEEIKTITKEDLGDFQNVYFSPGNMIISVVSCTDADQVLDRIEELFGQMSKVDLQPAIYEQSKAAGEARETQLEVGGPQSYICIGGILVGIQEERRPALFTANSLLSSRLASELREKRGWAYSIGSTISFFGNDACLLVTMGTREQNLSVAKTAILREITRVGRGDFDQRELERTINHALGRLLMRHLPRVNQAYYLGLNEFLWGDLNEDSLFMDRVRAVSLEEVRDAAKEYLQGENWLTIAVR